MAAPKTVKTYALNGAQKDFPISFEYLARKFVVVTLIGVNRKELVLNTDFRFSTPTQITTLRAGGWGTGDGYTLIEIRRVTSATERLVDFADGSILRAFDLNTSQVQSLHIAEEARDLTADTIGVNNDGNLDARARKIVNLADATDPGDAVNLRMEQQWAGSALNQANLSAASAAASEVSRQASLAQANISTTQAGLSNTARIASEAARDLANTYKGNSQTSATASNASAVAAGAWAAAPEDQIVADVRYSSLHYSRKSSASATASATSATASQASNQKAYLWSSQPENVEVQTGLYSALHWAAKAAASAALLGNMNAFAENITQAETAYGVIMKRSFKATKSLEAGESINAGTTITAQGNISSQASLYAATTIDSGLGTYDKGSRVWSSATFNPATKMTVGINSFTSQYATINAPIYNNLSAANQVYNSALLVQEAGIVGAGGPAPGHIYNAPSITFLWNGYNAMKLAMDTSGQMTWGNPNGVYCRLNPNGNIYGDAWGGYLSTYLANTLAGYLTPGNLLANLAAQSGGGVTGAYSLLKNISGATQGIGVLFSAASAQYSDTAANNFGAVPGTWRAMSAVAANACTVFIRAS